MDSKLIDSKHAQLVATSSYDTLPVYRAITEDNAQPPVYVDTEEINLPSTALTVTTAGPSLSSGFPYHPSLSEFNVSPGEWEVFTHELQNAAAATPCQKALAILSGIATAAVIIDPWTSSCVARYVWNKQVAKNVATGLVQGNNDRNCCGPKGETVGTVLERWNQKWGVSGVVVGLEIIQVGKEECETVEVEETKECTACCGKEGRCETKKCGSAKRNCGNRKCCTSRKAGGATEHCCRRKTCGEGRKNRQGCGRGKRGVSFKLVVQRTENGPSEKKAE